MANWRSEPEMIKCEHCKRLVTPATKVGKDMFLCPPCAADILDDLLALQRDNPFDWPPKHEYFKPHTKTDCGLTGGLIKRPPRKVTAVDDVGGGGEEGSLRYLVALSCGDVIGIYGNPKPPPAVGETLGCWKCGASE